MPDEELTPRELCYKIAYDALMHYGTVTNWHMCRTSGYSCRHYGYVDENSEMVEGFIVARKALAEIWNIQSFENLSKKQDSDQDSSNSTP